MPEHREAAHGAGNTLSGQGEKRAGTPSFRVQNTPTGDEKQGPSGAFPVYLRGDLIYVAGRHLCSLRNGELCRTFDASRELLRGGLAFRCDLLDLAERNGATVIVCTERQTKRAYRCDLATFRRLAWLYRSEQFGDQLCLSLDRWQTEPTAGEAVQLVLFETVR